MRVVANIYYYYRLFIIRIIRVAFLVFLEWFILSKTAQGVFPSFAIFSLLLFVLWEIFFHFKISAYRPFVSVSENKGDDIYASFTLQALAYLLPYSRVEAIIRTLLSQEQILFILKKSGIDSKDVSVIPFDKQTLAKASFDLASTTKGAFVTTIDVFGAYVLATEEKTKLLFSKEIKQEEFLDILHWAKVKYEEKELPKKRTFTVWGRGIGENWVTGWMIETKKYAFDFTKKVMQDPPRLAGRDTELSLLIQILSKSKRQNAIFVGMPGVGKTTIVASFAHKSFLGLLPKHLSHKRVYELSVASLLAGSDTQGILEQRITTMLDELTHAGDVILYIPELENIVGSGGFGFDASGALIPALEGDKLQVIASVTPQMYKRYIEGKGEFVAAFEKIDVLEPDANQAIRMLEEASLTLEERHHVDITYSAIREVTELSGKYVSERALSGKAIDLLDEAASHAALEKRKNVTREDIVTLIETKTKIPVAAPKKEEQALLLNLEAELHKRVIDQEEAVKAVSQALRRLRVGITFEHRPVGVFLFLGPTGVGKTDLARALASVYFKSEDRMVVLDMGSYKSASSIYRLIGSPPGTGGERGELTEKVRENPFTLLLLDEFEKADSSIHDAFVSIFEEGRLTDAMGRIVPFIDTIIIATSNAGSEMIRQKVSQGVAFKDTKEELLDTLQREGIFKPELINRFDAVVLFEPLNEEEMKQVTKLLLEKVSKKLAEQEITVSFDEKAITKIVTEGYDQEFGARPIRRYIQDHVEELLSQKMLRNEVKRGSKVVFSTDDANNITATVL